MIKSKKPNFFIIGSPKCGTTSLANWLREHPQVFVSNPKEPHFFNMDSDNRFVFELKQYEDLFSQAKDQHKAIGEASVWYLVSDVAIDNILAYQPDARFVVCLRNPIETAVSLHDQKIFSGDEIITDFEVAWRAQKGRQDGSIKMPPTCLDIKHYMYGESCLFGRLVSDLKKKVTSDQLLIILMDDLKSKPRSVYNRLLEHIGVENDNRTDFLPTNRAKKRKLMWLRRLLRYVGLLKRGLGLSAGTGMGEKLNAWNTVERERKSISPEMKKILVEYFSADIDLLQEEINTDLQHWKKI